MTTGIFIDLENLLVAIKTSKAKKDSDNIYQLVSNAVRKTLERELRTDGSVKVYFYIGVDGMHFVNEYLSDLVESGAVYVPVVGNNPDKATIFEMSLDMMVDSKIERYVIVGGASDYRHVIRRLIGYKVDVFVYGVYRSVSQSLINLVGKDNFRDITRMIFKKDPDPNFDPKSEEVLSRFMELLMDARENHPTENGEIWLNPFLKNYMNESFNNLNNDQRKQIIETAESFGLIQVNKKLDVEQNIEFTVIVINDQEPDSE